MISLLSIIYPSINQHHSFTIKQNSLINILNMSYKRNQQKNYEVSQPPAYQSGMSAQQKYLQIVQNVKNSINMQNKPTKKIKGCQMHPQPSKKCRKCKQVVDAIQKQSEDNNNEINVESMLQLPTVLRLNSQNPWASFSQKLLTCIQSTLKKNDPQQAKTVKQLVNSIRRDQISIDCYLKGTTQVTTQFILLFYRFIKMRPTYQQITIMLRHNNVNVKAIAMLYIRVYVNYEDVFGWIKGKLQDNDLINAEMTVSQFAQRLLDQSRLNYDGIRLPRLPIRIQRFINEQLGQVNINADLLRKQQMNREKLKQEERIAAEEQLRMEKIKQNLIKQKERKRKSRSKSRSREKNHKKNRSSSSSSSSSSSCSSSSSSSSQSQRRKNSKKEIKKQEQVIKKENKQEQKPDIKKQKITLEDLKSKMRSLGNVQEQKKKKKEILQRYGKIQQLQNKQHKLQNSQEQNNYEQSESEQKYQMG